MAPQLRDNDRYDILGEHGRGGLGRVSRAHDRELGRDIAIKELISRGHLSEVRFLREALITARLEHPGIVPVYEAGRWADGTPFYAMKLVSGRPLRDLIAERKTVDERLALLHHVIAVADAIAYAHGKNIIHRDLKPSNVIVGDFGETVVIDWGLAKDLTVAEESSVGDGPFRAADRDDGLTSAGTVLGTPAYMAPEQARGEPVDQRADVFAIGAMLWELCSLHKLPPSFSGQRRQLLRKAGIDPDLITIIEKAVDADPARRYRHAGALAADLKAFKAGARIAARRYTLWALVVHWFRRHRTLAASISTGLAILIVGGVLYIRNVAAERDRADASETRATQARAAAETSLDELTLKHAQLLLTTDPSAALDELARYHGTSSGRADQIRAEAIGRGIATLRVNPHTDVVRWAESTPDGSIISLSVDGTIVHTDSHGRHVVLSRDVTHSGKADYSTANHLLAYSCNPSNLCFYDVLHRAHLPPLPMFRNVNAAGISFSRDGSRLALMSADSTLRVIDVTEPLQPRLLLRKVITDGSDVVFIRNDIVLAGTPYGVVFVHATGQSEAFSVPDNSYWDSTPSGDKFVVATIHGDALLFEGSPIRISARIALCGGRVVGLAFIPGQRTVAYGCRDGTIGVWNSEQNTATPRVKLEDHIDLIRVSSNGEYIAIAGARGAAILLDLHTGITVSYFGHESRLSLIVPPKPEYPFLISADIKGSIRTWHIPVRVENIVTTIDAQFYTAIFDKKSSTIVASTSLSSLLKFSPSSGIDAIHPHEPSDFSLQQSNSGHTFAAYGLRDTVELWAWPAMTRTRLINTRHGSVSQLRYVDDSDDVVTAGRDGRVVRWAPSGTETLIAQLDQPIDTFVLLPASGSTVISSIDGALRRIDANDRTVLLAQARSRATRMILSPDQKVLVIGYANGDVMVFDTNSWRQAPLLRAAGAVREISITPDGHWIAVATNADTTHVGALDSDATHGITWIDLVVHARQQALAPDGLLLSVCNDGTIWFYSIPDQRWLYRRIRDADLRWVAISPAGNSAAALDAEGRLIWLDLQRVRSILDSYNIQGKGP